MMLYVRAYNDSNSRIGELEVKDASYLDYYFMQFCQDISKVIEVGDKITVECELAEDELPF